MGSLVAMQTASLRDAGSQDHDQRPQVIGRRWLMVISKGKQIKIYSSAFPQTALVSGLEKNI